jgi:hypothetical protein
LLAVAAVPVQLAQTQQVVLEGTAALAFHHL